MGFTQTEKEIEGFEGNLFAQLPPHRTAIIRGSPRAEPPPRRLIAPQPEGKNENPKRKWGPTTGFLA
jgi:hypothetical protein